MVTNFPPQAEDGCEEVFRPDVSALQMAWIWSPVDSNIVTGG